MGVAVIVMFGCKARAHVGSGAPGEPARIEARLSGSAGSAIAVVDPAVAALPGELWFIEQDVEPHKLVRLAAGKRLELLGDLTPAKSKLPDGRLVAVASRGGEAPDAEQLVLIAADGTLTRFGPTASHIRSPLVAPDGSWVIVEMSIDDHSVLHRIDLPSGTATPLTAKGEDNTAPESLGGDAIVFSSGRGGDFQLYRGSSKGGTGKPLTATHRWDFGALPSPDRKTLAFTSARDGATKVFLIAPDGTQLRRLNGRPDSDGDEGRPVWSPDGTRIAYVDTLHGVSQVSIRELATGTERIVTRAGADDRDPAWSPDGRWLLVARSFAGAPLVGDLWAIPVPAGEPLQITRTPDIEFEPRWF